MFPVTISGDPPPPERKICVASADGASVAWHVPEETPVAVVYNRRNYAIMMTTPRDLVDFGIGFSMSEQVTSCLADIEALDILYTEYSADLRFQLTPERLERLDIVQRRRNLLGAAGCGLCGIDNADTFFQRLPVVSDAKVDLDPRAVSRAFASLFDHQPLNRITRSVHAAAWARPDGEIVLAREDVGRHNALDKLLGALARCDTGVGDGFAVMSSRCSYELVEKAARAGVAAMAFVSGPTGLALRKAQQANMALYARGPDGVVELIG